MSKLQTVVELPEFQRRAKAIMSDTEREAAVVWIAKKPEAGTSLGGGFRTKYVFGGDHMPIFLITEIVTMWSDKQ
ncbi:MAG: hypothetical protein ABJJ53_05945 [Sulfitobacter sp.]